MVVVDVWKDVFLLLVVGILPLLLIVFVVIFLCRRGSLWPPRTRWEGSLEGKHLHRQQQGEEGTTITTTDNP